MHILLLWDHTCPSYYFSATVVLRNTEIDAAIQSTLLSAITIQDLGSKWSCTPQITHGPIRNEPHKKSGAVWYERVRITFGCMMEVTWLVWTMWRAVWTFSNFLSLCSTEETDTQTFVDLGKKVLAQHNQTSGLQRQHTHHTWATSFSSAWSVHLKKDLLWISCVWRVDYAVQECIRSVQTIRRSTYCVYIHFIACAHLLVFGIIIITANNKDISSIRVEKASWYNKQDVLPKQHQMFTVCWFFSPMIAITSSLEPWDIHHGPIERITSARNEGGNASKAWGYSVWISFQSINNKQTIRRWFTGSTFRNLGWFPCFLTLNAALECFSRHWTFVISDCRHPIKSMKWADDLLWVWRYRRHAVIDMILSKQNISTSNYTPIFGKKMIKCSRRKIKYISIPNIRWCDVSWQFTLEFNPFFYSPISIICFNTHDKHKLKMTIFRVWKESDVKIMKIKMKICLLILYK